LAAPPGQPGAGLRPGPVGGHHRRAGEHQALRRRARLQGHPPRARPVGLRRPPRLALMAQPVRLPPAALLLSPLDWLVHDVWDEPRVRYAPGEWEATRPMGVRPRSSIVCRY